MPWDTRASTCKLFSPNNPGLLHHVLTNPPPGLNVSAIPEQSEVASFPTERREGPGSSPTWRREDNAALRFWPALIPNHNHMGTGTCLHSRGLEASSRFRLRRDASFPQDALLKKKSLANVMLYNAIISLTAQHGSSACDLACDQLSFQPSGRAARGEGENRHRIWFGFQQILAPCLGAFLSPRVHTCGVLLRNLATAPTLGQNCAISAHLSSACSATGWGHRCNKPGSPGVTVFGSLSARSLSPGTAILATILATPVK